MCLPSDRITVLSLVENVVNICNRFIVSIFDSTSADKGRGLPLNFARLLVICPAHQVGFSHCVSGHLELDWGRAVSNEG